MRHFDRKPQVLAVPLTVAEFEARARDLARTIDAYRVEVEAQKSARTDMKLRLERLVDERDRLARIVDRRAEDRIVDTQLCLDDDRGIAYYVRYDTGEVYGERPMTADERQQALHLVASPAVPAADGGSSDPAGETKH